MLTKIHEEEQKNINCIQMNSLLTGKAQFPVENESVLHRDEEKATFCKEIFHLGFWIVQSFAKEVSKFVLFWLVWIVHFWLIAIVP